MGVSREDVTFEDHVSRGPQWGPRLQSGERCGLWNGLGPSCQRPGAAALGPLWPSQYLISAFSSSAPEGCCLSLFSAALGPVGTVSNDWDHRSVCVQR